MTAHAGRQSGLPSPRTGLLAVEFGRESVVDPCSGQQVPRRFSAPKKCSRRPQLCKRAGFGVVPSQDSSMLDCVTLPGESPMPIASAPKTIGTAFAVGTALDLALVLAEICLRVPVQLPRPDLGRCAQFLRCARSEGRGTAPGRAAAKGADCLQVGMDERLNKFVFGRPSSDKLDKFT